MHQKVELCEGRILRTEVGNSVSSLVFYDIHFYDIHKTHFSLSRKSVDKDNDKYNRNLHYVFWLGDFNVAKEGDHDIDHHSPLAERVKRANEGTDAKIINDLFNMFTEIEIDEPTDYTPYTGRLSSIDRFGSLVPSWQPGLFDISSSFIARPTTLSALKLSDHGILRFEFSPNPVLVYLIGPSHPKLPHHCFLKIALLKEFIVFHEVHSLFPINFLNLIV